MQLAVSQSGLDMESVLAKIKQDNVKFVRLQFTDLAGTIKSVKIMPERLGDAFERGLWFDGSSIEGFARIQESDMFLQPDPNTYSLVPWEANGGKTARLICDIFTPDGKPFEGCPRNILRNALSEALELGWQFNTGPEYEFFFFKKENGVPVLIPHDQGGYFDFTPIDKASDVRKSIILALEECGLEIETSHHEVASGQHEIDFKYSNALATADHSITLKYATKSIAQSNSLHASFMPKPLNGVSGSGMHVHQSLFTSEGRNVFFDEEGDFKLSKLARYFIAGQLAHAKALSAIVSPTVNSYKRLVPGFEAPVYICWGQTNRSALIRIPRYSLGKENAVRAEFRSPDPSCNPYLAFAAMLKAGLDGIKRRLDPPLPLEDDVYHFTKADLEKHGIETLPRTLFEAIEYLKKDEVVSGALGRHGLQNFLRLKETEWFEFSAQVTDWERDKFFHFL